MRIKFCSISGLTFRRKLDFPASLFLGCVGFFFYHRVISFRYWESKKKTCDIFKKWEWKYTMETTMCSWIACLWYEATRCGQKSRGKLRKRNIYQRHAIFGSWINWLFAHVGAEPMERNYQPDKILMMSGRANHGLLTQLLPEKRQDGCVWFTKIACTSARSIDQRIDDKRAEW